MIAGVDEATFDDVVDLYVANGHTLLGAGRSLKPADNGVQYDWYIRLPRPDGLERIDEGSAAVGQEKAAADQLTQVLDFALGPSQEVVPVAATDMTAAQIARIQVLEGTVQSLNSTLAQTSMELTSEKERATKLSRELKRVRNDLRLVREAAAAHPLPPVPLDVLVDHLLRLVELAGEEHVGVGTDFDGITETLAGFADASEWPNLTAALLARGLAPPAVRLILGGSFLRVLADAERRAG